MKPEKTIKERAHELLGHVDFVDCFGRPVGLDYNTILATIRREFPRARTTRNALKYIYDSLDRSSIRLPARHRSRKILCREFIRSLLLRDVEGHGLSYDDIRKRSRLKFPDTTADVRSTRRIVQLERQLIREGHAKVPTRD